MMNFVYLAIGTWTIIMLLKFCIEQFKNLGAFLVVINSNDQKKHSEKVMFFSLVKYLIVIFVWVLCIQSQLIFLVMFPFLVVGFYISYYYIKLWKYHGYSILILMIISFVVFAGAFVTNVLASKQIGNFIETIFNSNWINIIMGVLFIALIIYNVRSKQDAKLAAEKKSMSATETILSFRFR